MNIYTVKSTDIVHNTSVDLITRWSTREVHIVQYDNSQPIVAVELFKNSERFVIPDGYEANLRFGKKDRTFIYKPVLGCNQGRDTVYFAVDEQMSMFYGKVTPIIELTYNGAVVGSSSIPFVIDRNPIQIGDVESKTDYPAIVERISSAEAAVADAKKAVDAEAAERDAGDAKTLSDAKAYTDSSTSGLLSDSTTIKSNITTLQSDVASLKTDNIQNKTNISNKQDTLVSGMNIKTINGNSILGTGDITISGGGTNYITESTDKLILKPVNTNGNDFEVRTKDNDVVVWFTQNAPGDSSSYSLFDVILSTAPNEDGEIYNIVARFTKDENWDAKLNLSASAGSIGAGFDITIPPDAYGNIAMASDLEPLKTSIGNKQDTLVSGTNIKTINGESILGSGNIAISGGSGLAEPWSTDDIYLGVWSKSSPNLSENDFFAGLHTDDGLVGFEATNFTSMDTSVIIPTLTPEIPLFQFMNSDGSVTSMVKLPEDFFTRSQTINLGDIANSGGSGGSGLAEPWASDDKSLGINNQGVRSGLINMGNGEVGYGDIVYNNENMFTLLSVMLMSGDKSLNDIIVYMDTKNAIQSFVKLPADFKTRSQTIDFNFNLYRHVIEIEYGNEGYKIAFQADLPTDDNLNSFEKIREYMRSNTFIASGIVSKPGVVDPIAAQLIFVQDDASSCMITDVKGAERSIKDLATYGPNKDDYHIRITDLHIKKIGGLVDYEPVPGPK